MNRRGFLLGTAGVAVAAAVPAVPALGDGGSAFIGDGSTTEFLIEKAYSPPVDWVWMKFQGFKLERLNGYQMVRFTASGLYDASDW